MREWHRYWVLHTHNKEIVAASSIPMIHRTSEWKSNASGSCDQSLQEQKAADARKQQSNVSAAFPKKKLWAKELGEYYDWKHEWSEGHKQGSPQGKTTKWSDLGVNRPCPHKQLDVQTLLTLPLTINTYTFCFWCSCLDNTWGFPCCQGDSC